MSKNKALQIRIDEKTRKKFKLWCYKRGTTMSEEVTKVIELILSGNINLVNLMKHSETNPKT